jgi:flagellar biosynthesis protein FlhA
MEIELGVGLIHLADPKRGGDLLGRVQRVRQNVAADIGIILPKVRIRDNMRLDQNDYTIKIADVAVASATLHPGLLLAIDSGLTTGTIDGYATKEPAFGSEAVWIEPTRRDQAEMLGYTVVEPGSVIATHLTEVVRKHADEILTRDATQHLLDELKQTSPAVVNELIPDQMKLAEVQQVLHMLLREGVPIRQLGPILESLGDYAGRTKDSVLLTEYARHRLARAICNRYRDDEGRLHVITLDPALEDRVRAGIEHTERGLFIRMSPPAVEQTCDLIATEIERLRTQGRPPVVLVSPQLRAGLKRLTEQRLPNLVVLSYNEITRDTTIESHGMIADAASAIR